MVITNLKFQEQNFSQSETKIVSKVASFRAIWDSFMKEHGKI